MKKKLNNFLDELDKREIKLGYFGEHKIATQIRQILSDVKNKKENELAEIIAFDFIPYQEGQEVPRETQYGRTYYGPPYVFLDERDKTKASIYPHILQVTKNMISYWEKRAKYSKNPVLKCRYADLVIDFKPKVLGQRADVEFYRIVIDTNIIIARNHLAEPKYAKLKLKRALDLELQIKKKISEELKLAIIGLDSESGFEGFSFEWLVLNKSKKIVLSEKRTQSLLKHVFVKFKKANDPYILEYTTRLLAEYYRQYKNWDQVVSILKNFERRYKTYFKKKDPLSKIHAYQKILGIYEYYACLSETIGNEKNRIIKELKQLKIDEEKDFKTLSIEFEVEKDKIKDYLDNIFQKNCRLSIREIVTRLVISSLPDKKFLEKLYKNISTEYISPTLPTQICSNEGYIKATLNKNLNHTEEIKTANLFYQINKYTQVGHVLLHIALQRFKDTFKSEEILDYLSKRILFEDINHNILKKILDLYFREDYYIFSHLLVPVIEMSIRKLVKINDGKWLRVNGYGGFTPLTLTELLEENEQLLKLVYGDKLGENLVFYLKLTLTHPLGMSIRTDFAHGNDIEKFRKPEVADILFFILLILSLVVKNDNSNRDKFSKKKYLKLKGA